MIRELELLSPAKDLECGIEAVKHGADAVYIGASRFGARAAAGNSVSDIKTLCDYAHKFNAKVYVTLNTIVFDKEIAQMKELAMELSDAGADAFIVQDMALVELLKDCGTPLHASTQMDNRSVEKVKWLHDIGFTRVVLARELTLEEIRKIHKAVPDIELEVFVHGALCVSYSGQCYASQYCFNRSANKGECAQFCRLPFAVMDANGRTIADDKHLLSLKDLCLLDYMDRLVEAGATSFKIEGRLKDVSYVKNITAAYSNRLNEVIASSADKLKRAADGWCSYTFKPDVTKSFNRGFTTYFFNGRNNGIASWDTPKATGEYIGTVKHHDRHSIIIDSDKNISNGDGLCLFDNDNKLIGFRVNKFENNRIFPLAMPHCKMEKGMKVYRNYDFALNKLLSKESAKRKIDIDISIEIDESQIRLSMEIPQRCKTTAILTFNSQPAHNDQTDNIRNILTKTGNTDFVCRNISINNNQNMFVPSSLLTQLRRTAVEQLQAEYLKSRKGTPAAARHDAAPCPASYKGLPYLYNVSNSVSKAFYEAHGLKQAAGAFELEHPDEALLMQCKYCIRYTLGMCTKEHRHQQKATPPAFICLNDGKKFRLEFDCKNCQMNIYSTKSNG